MGLTNLKKDELQALADDHGVEYDEDDTRDDLIAMLREEGVESGGEENTASTSAGDHPENPRDPSMALPPDVIGRYLRPIRA